MNRFLVPAVMAVLLAGCAWPGFSGLQSKRLVVVDSVPAQAAAPTVIVRDIYHEASVVNQNTVYVEQPVPAEPVYIEGDYETYVYVSEPPPPDRHHPGWSPREHEQPPEHRPRPRVPSPIEAKPFPPGGRPVPPGVYVPPLPPKKTVAPATDGRQKSPDRPTPPVQPVPPKQQAPKLGGSAPAAPAQPQSPKQAPTPPADKPAGPGSGA